MVKCIKCKYTYTIKKRKEIICLKCNYKCCKQCFMENIIINNLKCEKCKFEYSLIELYINLGEIFINESYKRIKSEILYKTEESYFSDTKKIILNQNTINSLIKEKNKNKFDTDTKINKIMNNIDTFKKSIQIMKVSKVFEIIKYSSKEIKELKEILLIKNKEIDIKINSLLYDNNDNYLKHCPYDNCNMMLNKVDENNNLICDKCNNISCKSCKQIINDKEEHMCNPCILNSFNIIKNNINTCPLCKNINLQGYHNKCLKCNITYGWNILKPYKYTSNEQYIKWLKYKFYSPVYKLKFTIDHVFIKNLEYQLNTNQNLTDKIKINEIIKFLNLYLYLKKSINKFRINYIYEDYNKIHRISLLNSEIDIKEFKSLIYENYKKISKKENILNIVIMYVSYICDIIYRNLDSNYINIYNVDINNIVNNIYSEIIDLVNYCNENLLLISNIYSTESDSIDSLVKLHTITDLQKNIIID